MPLTLICEVFSASGRAIRRAERYWLLISPFTVVLPPFIGFRMVTGGQPSLVWIDAPSLVRDSVRSWMGRDCILLSPVSFELKDWVARAAVSDLAAVPAF